MCKTKDAFEQLVPVVEVHVIYFAVFHCTVLFQVKFYSLQHRLDLISRISTFFYKSSSDLVQDGSHCLWMLICEM